MKKHKKIDIYIKKETSGWYGYYASTNRSKTCKEAKARFLETHKYNSNQVKASFAK
jgi:hypothetical protein